MITDYTETIGMLYVRLLVLSVLTITLTSNIFWKYNEMATIYQIFYSVLIPINVINLNNMKLKLKSFCFKLLQELIAGWINPDF